jgi:hypothetical protein
MLSPRAAARPALLMVLSACLHERPETVLGRYLRAESDGRYEAAWQLLDPADRAARPLEAYAADHARAGLVWLAVARQTEFDLAEPAPADPARPEAGVIVEVVARHPQMRAAADTLYKALGVAGDVPVEDANVRVEEAAQVLQAMPVATVDERIRYVLRPEDRGWNIWIGLAEQDAAVALAARAGRAKAQGDTAAERAALEALLALPPDGQGTVTMLQTDAKERLKALP